MLGFLKGIGIAIGGVFVAIGGFFGAHAQQSMPIIPSVDVATEIPVQIDSPATPVSEEISIHNSSAAPRAVPAQPSLQPAAQAVASTPLVAPVLQIGTPRADVSEDSVTILWTTNIPSESQLILDSGKGKGYQSSTAIGTQHKVTIANPAESTEYDYEILAATPDKKMSDTYFSSFTAFEKFTATLGVPSDGCTPIIVKNTAGKIIQGMQIKVTEYNGATQYGTLPYTTNPQGEVETKNCKRVNKYIVSGDELKTTILLIAR